MTYEHILVIPRPLRAVVLADPPVTRPCGTDPRAADLAQQQAQELRDRKAEQEALTRVLGRLAKAAEELEAQRHSQLGELQQLAVDLAVAVASRLVHERIETNDLAVENLVRQAVQQLETDQPVKVFLHPLDLQLLEKRREASADADLDSMIFAPDPALQRGDCRVDAGENCVRFVVAEQLAALRTHLHTSLPDAQLSEIPAGLSGR